MFTRPHHQRIAHVLSSLNAPLLKAHHCLFGGGTVMALRFGEYRESLDIDFLVSDLAHYRALRQLLTSERGLQAIVREGAAPLALLREIRADQYGIRTLVQVLGEPIKLEIVLEGRITLDAPKARDEVCGIATLTSRDMATAKLLANSDRWADDGVFSRDVIDLAMMQPSLSLLRDAVEKAQVAYGASVCADLAKALNALERRTGWLDRCIKTMGMTQPKALVWQRLRRLRKVLPTVLA
ncbi:MAG: nucleotidyl transferase AbiEii/AbiGii toxin family protein [Brachymonas sp.]|nr:nucleotidyl transferase AbiEii/AbiGii toxin family protein [Brachymonas sp.]